MCAFPITFLAIIVTLLYVSNENTALAVTIEVRSTIYLLFKSSTCTCIFNLQPQADFLNNTMYAVNLLNLCTNATMEIMSNLKFIIPDPHMWTNITVIAKNRCGESLIPVCFNGTGEL